MQLSASFAALATVVLSAVTLAAPHPTKLNNEMIPIVKREGASLLKRGTNEVDFVKVNSHLNSLKAKYSQSLQNYQKNTGKASAVQAPNFQPFTKRGTGTDSLIDVQDGNLWTAPMTWGGQQIYFDLDTGSSDVVVNNDAYTPGSSAQDTGNSFTVSYGDGTTATCEDYIDNLTIAGLSARAAIGQANNEFISGEGQNNGIAGMAYPSIASSGEPPFFDALENAGALDNFVFTFKLSPNDATVYLGGVDPNSGSPTYTPVTQQGYWQVDSEIVGISTSGIVDTGTTVIVAPTSTAKQVFSKLGVSTFTQDGTIYGQYDCNNPPQVTISFGSYSQALSAATTSFGTNNGNCVMSVIGEDIGINGIIYGDSWLQNVYATFDRTNNQVGFAPQ